MTAPKDPVAPPVPHIGSIARELREAHMTRVDFSEQVNLSLTDYRRWEEGRLVLRVDALQRILRHPIMKDLARRAQAAGIVPPVPRVDEGSGGAGSGGAT